jgi:Coenzyme PQQ synthesis protein D (PqqD)
VTRYAKNPKRAPDARVRKIRGQIVVAGTTDVYELSEVAAEIWRLADGTRSVTEIAATLTEHYDVTLEAAFDDVKVLVDELARAELLVWV